VGGSISERVFVVQARLHHKVRIRKANPIQTFKKDRSEWSRTSAYPLLDSTGGARTYRRTI